MESNTLIELVDKEQVCSRLGISKRTLEGMVMRKEFPPAVRLGKCSMWSAQAVEEWLRQKFEHQVSWIN